MTSRTGIFRVTFEMLARRQIVHGPRSVQLIAAHCTGKSSSIASKWIPHCRRGRCWRGVGILVPSDRSALDFLQVRILIKHPVSLALPKSPSCQHAGDSFMAPERGTFYRAKSYVAQLRRLALKSLPTRGFQATNRQGSGRCRERARLCSSGVWCGDGQ
jgi:hypothetical protein